MPNYYLVWNYLDEDKEKISGYIDNTEVKLLTAIGNGLFNQDGVGGEEAWKKIENLLGEARVFLEQGKFAEAETKQATALGHLHDALTKPKAYWRFVNIHAAPIWIYLLGVLVSLFVFFYSDVDTIIQTKMGVSEDVVYVVAWGVIGGILRALWKIKKSVGGQRHKRSFRIYYLSSPFLGGIFGAITYLLIIGGLVSINGTNSPASIIPILPIAAFAGFNWEWAVGLFNRIADVLSVDSKDKSE